MSNHCVPGTPLRARPSIATVALWLAATSFAGHAMAASTEDFGYACRSLAGLSSTPLIDYNDPTMKSRLEIVESYHFNSDVRSLRKGESSTVPGDLDFVLRNVPNHYDALAAMGRWQVMNGPPRSTDGGAEPAPCYFQRAIEYRPTDPRLHLVYGVYLHQSKRLSDAERQYQKAESMGGGDAELYYNMGLLMVDMGNIPRAKEYAEKAYALGYPLPGLRNKIRAHSAN